MNRITDSKRRKLGQHFIFNENILWKIVEYADLSVDDVVLEVGAGLGGLTSHIAERGVRVIAIEKDYKLFNKLKYRFSKIDNVKLICGDILKIKIPYFNKIISNIPYSISRRFLIWILKKKFTLAVLLLQDEFAQKLAAKPGSKEYSWISATTQHIAKVNLADLIPKYNFHPPPEVNSRIVIIKPEHMREPLKDDFEKFLLQLFSFKNKTVRNALKLLKSKYNKQSSLQQISESLDEKNFSLDKKVRQLSVKEIERLFENIYRNTNSN